MPFKLCGRIQKTETLQTVKVWNTNQIRGQYAAAPQARGNVKACAVTATTVPPLQLNKEALKVGVLDRYVPLASYDTACTSNAGMSGGSFIHTTKVFTKVFDVATG